MSTRDLTVQNSESPLASQPLFVSKKGAFVGFTHGALCYDNIFASVKAGRYTLQTARRTCHIRQTETTAKRFAQ